MRNKTEGTGIVVSVLITREFGFEFKLTKEDTVDFLFTLFSANKFQLVFELDHSQSHEKHGEDDHACKNLNLHPDRSVIFVRSVKVGHNSIGSYHHVNFVKPGDITRAFGIANPPTKSKPTMPQFDNFDPPKQHVIATKELR